MLLGGAAIGFAAEYAVRRERPLDESVLRWSLIAWNIVAVASIPWLWREGVFVSTTW